MVGAEGGVTSLVASVVRVISLLIVVLPLKSFASTVNVYVFAGGLDTVPFGRIGRTMLPLFLLMPPVMELLPPLALIFAAFGVATGPTVLVWAAISCAATLIWWIVVYATVRENPLYALLYPLGALMLLYIFLSAVIRGRRVSWKGRTYISQ